MAAADEMYNNMIRQNDNNIIIKFLSSDSPPKMT